MSRIVGWLARATAVLALVTPLAFLSPRSSAAHQAALTTGGSIVVARRGDFQPLDPATAIDYESFRVMNELFSGLMGIAPNNTLYPDLAASLPTISNGARTYTFHLRPGLRFADGTPLTANDVAFSINRAADPKIGSWGVGILSDIAGYDAVEAGKAKTLSGVQVLDPLTIRFMLTQPDGIFSYKMTMSTFYVVEPRQVARYGSAFGAHPLGSGPFKFVSYVPGQRLVVARNPYYYRKDANGVQLPYLDQITWLVNVDDSVAVLKYERGEVDVLADGAPKESYAAVAADPRFSKLLIQEPSLVTYQVGFNAQMKPFTDVRVRRAFAMAINRNRLIKLLGKSRVFLSTQRYPQGLAGWDPTYVNLPYDPTTAKALLAQAGYPNGFTTTYLVGDWGDSGDSIVGQAIQQDLSQIGVNVTIRTASSATAGSLTNQPHTIPLFTEWWGPDFPEVSDFIGAQFLCAAIPPHGSNNLFYCNHQVDKLYLQAISVSDAAARTAVERQLQRILLDDVAVFPLFQANWVTLRPERLANFYIHPVWQWDYAYYRLAR